MTSGASNTGGKPEVPRGKSTPSNMETEMGRLAKTEPHFSGVRGAGVPIP